MKNKILLISGFLLILALPALADQPQMLGLVPCFANCTPCDLWVLANNIVFFLTFYLATPVLVLALLAAGIVLLSSSGNPAQIEKGKKILTSSIIGIFIAFGGFLIVDTIVKTLAGNTSGNFQGVVLPWNQIEECPAPIVTPLPPPPPPPITEKPPAGTFQTEEEARAFFKNTGIEINKGPCTATQTTNCTDLKGLPISAAEKLKALATSGGFCLSGATEGQGTIHQTHGVGKPIVDIKPSPCSSAININELGLLRNLAGFQAKEAVCESQNGVLRSSNSSCLISSRGTPFTTSQLNQLNHIHVVFP